MRWFDETGRVRFQPMLSTGERLWWWRTPFGTRKVWSDDPDVGPKYLTRFPWRARRLAAKEERRRARVFRHPESR